ncbi:MAG: glycosyltransferase family 2 protein [Erysipelotrichaceae bacterium]|nr:glycosyltransferase family 2 protein [Erysipelotrichaceae bacterium]
MLGIFDCMMKVLFLLLFSYQGLYILISLFGKEKEKDYELKYHDFAVLICARNEETVIGNLLESIDRQTYPEKHYRTFVMADNCIDSTAEIAKGCGAVVYTRNDDEYVGKGYALESLLRNIEKDYGDVFDAFLVFDADNILKDDYLEQMNISYCQGNKIIAGYINSKNYGSNWISAGYSLYLLRKNRFLNNARHLLGLSSAINGTGFLFDKETAKEWPYHTLTEDIEFTVDQVCRHHTIAYCDKAIVYDEQPTSFVQSVYQRLRWSKGYLEVIWKYSTRLVKGICEGSFSCFDMLSTILSAYGLSVVSLIFDILMSSYLIVTKSDMIPFLSNLLEGLLKAYLCMYLIGLLTTITEWKRINTRLLNKIRYTFTFPLFMASYIPIAVCALFADVSWKPIRHTVTITHENSL